MSKYRTYIKKMRNTFKRAVLDIHYEYVDKKNGSINVHIHMMAHSETEMHKLEPPKGYYVDFSEVNNTFAWKNYIEKNQLNEVEVIQHCEDRFNHIPITPLKGRSNSRNEVRKYTRGQDQDDAISDDEETIKIYSKLKMTKKSLFTT